MRNKVRKSLAFLLALALVVSVMSGLGLSVSAEQESNTPGTEEVQQIGKAEQQPGSSCIIFAAYQQDHICDDGKSASEEIHHRKGFSIDFCEPPNPIDGQDSPNIQ